MTTNRSSPFFTPSPGMMKTLVFSSGIDTSQSHCKQVTSCSRVPVLTLNNTISLKCSGKRSNNCACSSHDKGYGFRASSTSNICNKGAVWSQVKPCSSRHNRAARFKILRTTAKSRLIVLAFIPCFRRCWINLSNVP